MMLEYKGYSVLVAERADHGIQLLKTKPFDLIIMDMLLSGMSGIDVCSNLKNDPVISSVPLIMISAHPTAREMCIEAGADDFISKPFDMTDLLSRIGVLIEPCTD
jgi:two-component system alkaline phosphatase synthesis response regulator PhoP